MTKEIREYDVIPKDCAVCDFCNISITDGNFIAIRQAWWYENHLICDDCNRNYADRGKENVMDIMERDDLSHISFVVREQLQRRCGICPVIETEARPVVDGRTVEITDTEDLE